MFHEIENPFLISLRKSVESDLSAFLRIQSNLAFIDEFLLFYCVTRHLKKITMNLLMKLFRNYFAVLLSLFHYLHRSKTDQCYHRITAQNFQTYVFGQDNYIIIVINKDILA